MLRYSCNIIFYFPRVCFCLFLCIADAYICFVAILVSLCAFLQLCAVVAAILAVVNLFWCCAFYSYCNSCTCYCCVPSFLFVELYRLWSPLCQIYGGDWLAWCKETFSRPCLLEITRTRRFLNAALLL